MQIRKSSLQGRLIAMTLALCCSMPLTYAQTIHPEKVVMTTSKKTLKKVLKQLSRRYGYHVYYTPSLLKGVDVSASIEGLDIDNAMKVLLSGAKFQYKRYKDVT